MRLPDWVCSAITLGVGAAFVLQNPATRAEIRAFPAKVRGLVRRRPGDAAPTEELSELRS